MCRRILSCARTGPKHPAFTTHHFRSADVPVYLKNPEGKLEHAQSIAAHADHETKWFYGGRGDQVSMGEVERIEIQPCRTFLDHS
jgi:hypothetical protein